MSDVAPVAKAGRTAHRVAWQGWLVDLPRRWDPVQLNGDASAGYALFADALRPRVGLRWQTPRRGRGFDPAEAVRRTLVAEVGSLAAVEAEPHPLPDGDWASPLLYVEPDPPGRDVWVAYSPASGRVLSVACPVHRRERVLAGLVLPTVAEAALDRAAPWAIFDLSLTVPGGFALAARSLNAGDLALTFADRRGATLAVRQIAVAELALRRRSLDGWIADQQRADRRHYRPAGPIIDASGGRLGRLSRRRRFALATWHPPSLSTLAIHDAARDRLVILHGTEEDLLTAVAATVGAVAV